MNNKVRKRKIKCLYKIAKGGRLKFEADCDNETDDNGDGFIDENDK